MHVAQMHVSNYTLSAETHASSSIHRSNPRTRQSYDPSGRVSLRRGRCRWLKGWDACVFGADRAGHSGRRGGATGGPAGGAPGAAGPPAQPEQRILLLCGAPGARYDQINWVGLQGMW